MKKKILQETYMAQQKKPQKPLVSVLFSKEELQFQTVFAKGRYLMGATLLMQNQFYHNQLGYEVFTPFEIAGQKKLLLVDRGWIAKGEVSQFSCLEETPPQKIVGYIKLLEKYHFILGKNILSPHVFPLMIQKIDIKEIGQMMQKNFFPFILRLDSKEKCGFIRQWHLSTVEPQRHLGYALQWFMLAIGLAVVYFFCCLEVDVKK